MGIRDKLKRQIAEARIGLDIAWENMMAEGDKRAEAYWAKHPEKRGDKHKKKEQ